MKNIIFILLISSLLGCHENPKLCELTDKPLEYLLTLEYNTCGKDSIRIKNDSLVNFINDELCKSKSKFIVNEQGDSWYIRLNSVSKDDFTELTLTKTYTGIYYFRDKQGTYVNDLLAQSLVILTGIECRESKSVKGDNE